MKCWIIIFDGSDQIPNADPGGQFFLYFPDQRLPRRLAGLYLSARKFPLAFIFSVSSGCGEDLALCVQRIAYDCCYYFYCLHVSLISFPLSKNTLKRLHNPAKYVLIHSYCSCFLRNTLLSPSDLYAKAAPQSRHGTRGQKVRHLPNGSSDLIHHCFCPRGCMREHISSFIL